MNDKTTGPKLITDKSALTKAIDSIANRAKKLDNDVQLAGLSAIAHLDKHGDVTFVNRLYLALGKGTRRRALAEWFMAFAKVTPNQNADTKRDQPFAYDKSKTTRLDGATLEPWFDFAPEPAVDQLFDVRAALHRIVQRASKAPSVNDTELLGRLREIDAHVAAGQTIGPVEEHAEQQEEQSEAA